MSAKKKDVKKDQEEIKETETIELDETELEEGMDLQELADQLGSEHKKEKQKKKKGFFSKKSDDSKEIRKLNDQLNEKDEKIKELEQSLKAMVAENRNQKVRIENEFRSKIRFANDNFFRDFVTVKDDFDKAMEFVPTDEESDKSPFIQGVKHLMTKTENIMKSHGLESFSSVGEAFDPNLHQAMSVIDVEGKDANEIVTEYMKGYKYRDRVLRPSMVVVASGNDPKKEEEVPASEDVPESEEEVKEEPVEDVENESKNVQSEE